MTKAHIESALMVLGVIMAVAAFQRHVVVIPVIGEYLPK
jgi:hypothetical protein